MVGDGLGQFGGDWIEHVADFLLGGGEAGGLDHGKEDGAHGLGFCEVGYEAFLEPETLAYFYDLVVGLPLHFIKEMIYLLFAQNITNPSLLNQN